MRDKVSIFSYEICFYGSTKDVCIKLTRGFNFSAYSNAIFPYFLSCFSGGKSV